MKEKYSRHGNILSLKKSLNLWRNQTPVIQVPEPPYNAFTITQSIPGLSPQCKLSTSSILSMASYFRKEEKILLSFCLLSYWWKSICFGATDRETQLQRTTCADNKLIHFQVVLQGQSLLYYWETDTNFNESKREKIQWKRLILPLAAEHIFFQAHKLQ